MARYPSDGTIEFKEPGAAPVGELETRLAAIWAEVLKVKHVGRQDSFFDLGGRSLLAMMSMVARVRKELGAEVHQSEVFARPLLREFAAGLEGRTRASLSAITAVARNGAPLEVSFAQERMWFLAHFGGLNAAYHIMPLGFRLVGDLDRGALRRALDRVVARHEPLRTTFVAVDGHPKQRVGDAEVGFALEEHDVRQHAERDEELERIKGDEARRPFDLERGPPVRGRLIQLAEDEYVLLVTMHHIVSDGWSVGVLVAELGALYAAFRLGQADPLPPLTVQYADYAAWQRRWLAGDMVQRQVDYWRKALAAAPPPLDVPTDRPRPTEPRYEAGSVGLELDEDLTRALKSLGERHGATLHMTILAGWAVLLSRLSRQLDMVIGTPVANRTRSEIEGLIGFFVNMLAIRVDLSGGPTVSELIERVKARALEAQEHQDLPFAFERITENTTPRGQAQAPMFQVVFGWQNYAQGAMRLPGLSVVEESTINQTAKRDLSLILMEVGGKILGGMQYSTALFDRATVERHLSRLRRVLEGMVRQEALPVDRLELDAG